MRKYLTMHARIVDLAPNIEGQRMNENECGCSSTKYFSLVADNIQNRTTHESGIKNILLTLLRIKNRVFDFQAAQFVQHPGHKRKEVSRIDSISVQVNQSSERTAKRVNTFVEGSSVILWLSFLLSIACSATCLFDNRVRQE